jgi:predicted SprT family Zn-dependent metalloprotease
MAFANRTAGSSYSYVKCQGQDLRKTSIFDKNNFSLPKDSDHAMAMEIHRLINGADADLALQMQGNMDISEEDRQWITINTGLPLPPRQLSNYPVEVMPWEVPRRPLQLLPQPVAARPLVPAPQAVPVVSATPPRPVAASPPLRPVVPTHSHVVPATPQRTVAAGPPLRPVVPTHSPAASAPHLLPVSPMSAHALNPIQKYSNSWQKDFLVKRCLDVLTGLFEKISNEKGPEFIKPTPEGLDLLSKALPGSLEDLSNTKVLSQATITEFGQRVLEVTVPFALQDFFNRENAEEINQNRTIAPQPAGNIVPATSVQQKLAPQATFRPNQPSTSASNQVNHNLGSSSIPSQIAAFFNRFPVAPPSTSILAVPQTKIKVEPGLNSDPVVMRGDVGVANVSDKRTSPEDYFVPSLSGFVQLGPEQVWKKIETKPLVQHILYLIKDKFFRGVVGIGHPNVFWSNDFTDLTNFRIVDKQIYLNEKVLLKRSRGDLFSVLFHAMIHISCFVTSQRREKCIDEHDVNFQEIKNFFNEHLDLNIGTHHSFLQNMSPESVYSCQGTCSKNAFRGIFRSFGPEDQVFLNFVREHNVVCTGTLQKVYTAQKTVDKQLKEVSIIPTDATIREVQRPSTAGVSTHQVANPQAIVDITDENMEGPANVVNLLETIDVDEPGVRSHRVLRKVIAMIKESSIRNLGSCPVCSNVLRETGLRAHLEVCFS